MSGRPYVSPRGAEAGRPFRNVVRLTRSNGVACYAGELNGAAVTVERAPDDPTALVLTIEIRSARASWGSTTKPSRGARRPSGKAVAFDNLPSRGQK